MSFKRENRTRVHAAQRLAVVSVAFLGCRGSLLGCNAEPKTLQETDNWFRSVFVAPLLNAAAKSPGEFERLVEGAKVYQEHYASRVPYAHGHALIPLDAPIMPAPGRPRLVLPIESRFEIELPSTVSEVSFDLVPLSPDFNLELYAATTKIDFVGGDGITAMNWNDGRGTQELDTRYYHQVHIRFADSLICVDQLCASLSPGDASLNVLIDSQGSVALSNVQYYEGDEFKAVGLHLEPEGIAMYSGVDVRTWERIAQEMTQGPLALYVVAELCDELAQSHTIDCKSMREAASGVATAIARRVTQWPEWRAYDASLTQDDRQNSVDFGSWDRGSWSNGYMPLAVALAGAYLSQRGQPLPPGFSTALKVKGLDYVDDLRFPSIEHWVQRSTNHGQLILGGAWAAALIDGRCTDTEVVRSLRSRYLELASWALPDGGYPESLGYISVFLMYGIYGPLVQAACSKESIHDYVRESIPDIARLGTFVDAISDSLGRPIAQYGDGAAIEAWDADLVHLVAGVTKQRKAVAALAESNPSSLGDPYLRRVLDSPPKQFTNDFPRGCWYFPSTGIGTARLGNVDNTVTVAILGMPIHKTHNKDFDVGSISVSRAGRLLLGDTLDGRAPRIHNSIGAIPSQGSDLELCEDDICGARTRNGSLESLPVPVGCAFSAQVDGNYLLLDDEPLLSAYRRTMWAFDDDTGVPWMLIVDRGSRDHDGVDLARYLNFLTSVDLGTPTIVADFGHVWSSGDLGAMTIVETPSGQRIVERVTGHDQGIVGAWLMRIDGGKSKGCSGQVETEAGRIRVSIGSECLTRRIQVTLDELDVTIEPVE